MQAGSQSTEPHQPGLQVAFKGLGRALKVLSGQALAQVGPCSVTASLLGWCWACSLLCSPSPPPPLPGFPTSSDHLRSAPPFIWQLRCDHLGLSAVAPSWVPRTPLSHTGVRPAKLAIPCKPRPHLCGPFRFICHQWEPPGDRSTWCFSVSPVSSVRGTQWVFCRDSVFQKGQKAE